VSGLGMAFSGTTLATSANSLGFEHQCPCGSAVWLFSEPAGGWSGTVVATPVAGGTTETGYIGVALAGDYLFTTGGSTVQVYKLTGRFGHKVRPPIITFPDATGLESGNPRLSFKIRCAANGPQLTSLMLELPRGLRFSDGRERLTRAISIAGSHGYTLATRTRALLVTLKQPATTLNLTIGARALVESKKLIDHVQQVLKHAGHQRIVILRANLRTSESIGPGTSATIRFVAAPRGG